MSKKRTGENFKAWFDAIVPRWREVAAYSELLPDYFRLVREANEHGELVESSSDAFLRWAKDEQRRRNEQN